MWSLFHYSSVENLSQWFWLFPIKYHSSTTSFPSYKCSLGGNTPRVPLFTRWTGVQSLLCSFLWNQFLNSATFPTYTTWTSPIYTIWVCSRTSRVAMDVEIVLLELIVSIWCWPFESRGSVAFHQHASFSAMLATTRTNFLLSAFQFHFSQSCIPWSCKDNWQHLAS